MYYCETPLGTIAKQVLSTTKETPWNKEMLDGWREVAVAENVEKLYESIY